MSLLSDDFLVKGRKPLVFCFGGNRESSAGECLPAINFFLCMVFYVSLLFSNFVYFEVFFVMESSLLIDLAHQFLFKCLDCNADFFFFCCCSVTRQKQKIYSAFVQNLFPYLEAFFRVFRAKGRCFVDPQATWNAFPSPLFRERKTERQKNLISFFLRSSRSLVRDWVDCFDGWKMLLKREHERAGNICTFFFS